MAKTPKKKQLGGLIGAARRLFKSPVTKRTSNKIKKEISKEYYDINRAMKDINKNKNASPKKKMQSGGDLTSTKKPVVKPNYGSKKPKSPLPAYLENRKKPQKIGPFRPDFVKKKEEEKKKRGETRLDTFKKFKK